MEIITIIFSKHLGVSEPVLSFIFFITVIIETRFSYYFHFIDNAIKLRKLK